MLERKKDKTLIASLLLWKYNKVNKAKKGFVNKFWMTYCRFLKFRPGSRRRSRVILVTRMWKVWILTEWHVPACLTGLCSGVRICSSGWRLERPGGLTVAQIRACFGTSGLWVKLPVVLLKGSLWSNTTMAELLDPMRFSVWTRLTLTPKINVISVSEQWVGLDWRLSPCLLNVKSRRVVRNDVPLWWPTKESRCTTIEVWRSEVNVPRNKCVFGFLFWYLFKTFHGKWPLKLFVKVCRSKGFTHPRNYHFCEGHKDFGSGSDLAQDFYFTKMTADERTNELSTTLSRPPLVNSM